MKQFKYTLEDLARNKLNYFFIVVQLLIGLIIFNMFFTTVYQYLNFKKNISKLQSLKNTYISYETTSNDRFNEIAFNDDNFQVVEKLYNELFNNELFTMYTCLENYTEIPSLNKDFYLYSKLTVNNEFYNFQNYEISEGEGFTSQDFATSPERVPVLLGAKLGEKIKVGQVFEDIEKNKFIVRGILKEGSIMFNVKSSPFPINVDEAFVVPVNIQANKNIPYYTSLIDSSMIQTNDIKNLNVIVEKSNELNLFNYHFKTLNDQISYVEDTHTELFIFYALLLTISVTFLLVSIYSTVIQYINKHIYEFAIHLLVGCTYVEILKRIFCQVVVLMIIPNIIIMIFNGLSLNTICILLFSIVFASVVSCLVGLKIKRTNLLKLIRR